MRCNVENRTAKQDDLVVTATDTFNDNYDNKAETDEDLTNVQFGL